MDPSWGPRLPNGLQKLWRCAPKTSAVRPKSGSGYEPAFEDRSRASWPRFWGGQGSIFDDFWMIFGSFLAYFGHVFACSFLPWFSSFLVRSSANFAKKIQELAEANFAIGCIHTYVVQGVFLTSSKTNCCRSILTTISFFTVTCSTSQFSFQGIALTVFL